MNKRITKNKSIKNQLMFIMTSIVVILVLGLTLSLSVFLGIRYNDEIDKNNKAAASFVSKNITSFINTAYKVTEDLSEDPRILGMDTEVQHSTLLKAQERNEFFELLYVQGMDGMQTGKSQGELLDRSTREWFKKIKSEMKPFVYKSFYSSTSHNLVTSIYMPMYVNDEPVGVIGSNIKLDFLQKIVDENSSEEDGRYSFVIDGDGNIIAHPDKTMISEQYNYKNLTKTVKELDSNGNTVTDDKGIAKLKEEKIEIAHEYQDMVSNVLNNQTGTMRFKDIDGENYFAAYSPVILSGNSDNWGVITLQQQKKAISMLTSLTPVTMCISIVILIIAIIAIRIISNKVSLPLIKISKLLSTVSTGDFTVRSDVHFDNEIGVLSDSVNIMIDNVSKLLLTAKDMASGITDSSEILSEKSAQTFRVANEINVAVNEIAVGASKQAEDAECSAELGVNMTERFKQLTEKSILMTDEADSSYRVTSEGINSVEELKKKTQNNISVIEKTEASVSNLNEKSKVIETILEALKGICEQTQLLALNASIEAARAGEAGKGFSVVASEIQKLAEESETSTKEIAEIMFGIKQDIENSVQMMRNIKDSSGEQFAAVEDVNESFEKISRATENIKLIINEVDDFVRNMDNANNGVVSSINNIAAVSEETAACAEEVTASLNEQTEAVGEVEKQANELKDKAKNLEIEINKFKVN